MKKINETELHELFCKLKDKEKGAYEELYQKYSSLVYHIAFSILKKRENAEDIMQNVFLKIAKLPEDKLPSKYEASWLYSVTKNEAITFLRRNKETVPVEEYIEGMQIDEIEELMQKDAYEKMISSLEQKEKQIVSLKVETGLSFKEIATLLNMPMGTVQWKYYKSLHSIKLLIGNLSLFMIAITLGITKLCLGKKNREEKLEIEEKEEVAKQETMIEEDTVEDEKILKKEELSATTLENQVEDRNEKVKQENEEYQTTQQIGKEEVGKKVQNHMGKVTLLSILLVLVVFTLLVWRKKKKR